MVQPFRAWWPATSEWCGAPILQAFKHEMMHHKSRCLLFSSLNLWDSPSNSRTWRHTLKAPMSTQNQLVSAGIEKVFHIVGLQRTNILWYFGGSPYTKRKLLSIYKLSTQPLNSKRILTEVCWSRGLQCWRPSNWVMSRRCSTQSFCTGCLNQLRQFEG